MQKHYILTFPKKALEVMSKTKKLFWALSQSGKKKSQCFNSKWWSPRSPVQQSVLLFYFKGKTICGIYCRKVNLATFYIFRKILFYFRIFFLVWYRPFSALSISRILFKHRAFFFFFFLNFVNQLQDFS